MGMFILQFLRGRGDIKGIICHKLELFKLVPTTIYSAVYSQFISYL